MNRLLVGAASVLAAVSVSASAADKKPYTRNVAIVVYENAEPLDWTGPYEVYNDAGNFAAVDGQPAWTPERGLQHLPLRFTYSCEGPQHIELLEGPPDSVWDGRQHPGVHHVGVWSDDVAGETQAMVAAGWTVRLAQTSPDDGYGAYTYVQPPGSKMLVELVTAAARPRFEQWWAGGRL